MSRHHRPSRRFPIGLALVTLALSGPAQATADASSADPALSVDAYALAHECPDLFGSPEDARRAAARRANRLRFISEGKRSVLVVHSADHWRRARELRLPGWNIDAVGLSTDDQPVAVVRIPDTVRPPRCPPGPYVLTLDDRLGDRAHVLGMTEGLLFLEVDDRLAYVRFGDAPGRDVGTAWASPWPINPYAPSKAKSSRTSRSPARKPKAPPPRAPRSAKTRR